MDVKKYTDRDVLITRLMDRLQFHADSVDLIISNLQIQKDNIEKTRSHAEFLLEKIHGAEEECEEEDEELDEECNCNVCISP